MRLVGYVRVSSDSQIDGLGLDVQREAINRWSLHYGHELVTVLADEGVSGTVEATDRPGLSEALSVLVEGRAEGLVVHKLDRLARRLTAQEAALAFIWRSGASAFTVDGGEVPQDDPQDPM